MRGILLFVAVIATVSANLGILREWDDYKKRYGKNYSPIENIQRKAAYIANSNQIRLHNQRFDRGCETYKLGINQFTDMTYREFAQIFNENSGALPGGNPLPPVGQCNNRNDNSLPWTNFDWRNYGAVSFVRNQGNKCNAGWAFASLAALESRTFVVSARLPAPLSPQNLIDCVAPSTCASKTPVLAYDFVIRNQNVNTELVYRYTGQPGTCTYNPNNIGATCAAQQTITGTDTNIRSAIELGPVVFEFDPLSFTFMHYESGVYRPVASRRPSNGRHYMAIVGYGNDPQGGNYWIVKNSFGTTWGEQGYMRLSSTQANSIGSVTFPVV